MSSNRFSVAHLVATGVLCAVAGGAVGRLSVGKKTAGVNQETAPVLAELERTGHTVRATTLTGLCARQLPCDCAQSVLTAALDYDMHEVVLKRAQGPFGQCKEGELDGVKAEAIARSRAADEAITLAKKRLSVTSADASALYAMAHAFYVKGDNGQAAEYAKRAIDAGRGETAHLLAGLIAYQSKDYRNAEKHFRAMLDENPESVDALYNLGVAAAAQNRYRAARERFLATLRVDPTHQGARYNLAIITHARGIQEEAEHHLKEYAALVGENDPRLLKLREQVSRPIKPPAPATSAGGAGAGGASASVSPAATR